MIKVMDDKYEFFFQQVDKNNIDNMCELSKTQKNVNVGSFLLLGLVKAK
jgi:hypothetical protein